LSYVLMISDYVSTKVSTNFAGCIRLSRIKLSMSRKYMFGSSLLLWCNSSRVGINVFTNRLLRLFTRDWLIHSFTHLLQQPSGCHLLRISNC